MPIGAAAVSAVLALMIASAVARADGDPPRIGVDPVRVAAGGTVTVHGIDFADAGPVSIVLVDATGLITPIATATADEYGGFMTAVTIPATTTPGGFLLRAIPTDGMAVDGALTVAPPVPERGEQRGADEPLIAPLPSGALPPIEAPVTTGEPAPAGISPMPDTVSAGLLPIAVTLGVVMVATVLVSVVARRRT